MKTMFFLFVAVLAVLQIFGVLGEPPLHLVLAWVLVVLLWVLGNSKERD